MIDRASPESLQCNKTGAAAVVYAKLASTVHGMCTFKPITLCARIGTTVTSVAYSTHIHSCICPPTYMYLYV